MLRWGNRAAKRSRFVFETEKCRGEVEENVFYISQEGKYGDIQLADKYLESEFFCGEWSGKLFDVLADRLQKYGFRAVGFRVDAEKSGKVKLIVIPDFSKYEKGRKVIDSFFQKQKIKSETLLIPYDKFNEEVLTEILPYSFEVKGTELVLSEEFDTAYVEFCNSVWMFLNRKELHWNYGVCVIRFVLAFLPEAEYEQMENFMLGLESEGFLGRMISSSKKAVRFNGAEEDSEKRLSEFVSVENNARSNYVVVDKLLNFNPGLSSSEMRLSWALSIYRSVYYTTKELFIKSQGKAYTLETDDKKLRLAERLIDSVLRGIHDSERGDLMFGSDTVFSFNDFKEAGLIWIVGMESAWTITCDTPKIRKVFEIIQCMDEKRVEKFDRNEMDECIERMYSAAKEQAVLRMSWWL